MAGSNKAVGESTCWSSQGKLSVQQPVLEAPRPASASTQAGVRVYTQRLQESEQEAETNT